MKIIDFHAHIYPPKISRKAVASIGGFYALDVEGDGTPDALIKSGKKADISSFVVHSVAISPKNVISINDFIAGECAKNPHFIGFGTLHPDMEDPLSEIGRIKKLGLKGIKLHPDFQRFNMDDRKMNRIYDALQGDLPVLFHCGDYRYSFSHPKRLISVLSLFPKLTAIAAHFGGWSIFDIAVEHLKNTDCYLDTSSSIMFLGKERSKELIRLYGAERFVFGSDFPMWNPENELQRYFNLELTQQENRLILHDNAARILNL